MKLPTLLPYYPHQYQFAGGYVPVNVVDGKHLFDGKLMMIKREIGDSGKGRGKVKNIRDYKKTFFNQYPNLKGSVVVHHAIEQQVLKRYPDLFCIYLKTKDIKKSGLRTISSCIVKQWDL